jgi:phosphate transport system ATP-binding protein
VSKRLDAEDVSAWYGENQAVADVSLDIEPKQVTALIGPSGCGKSTFIRTLNRMHEAVPGARMAGKVRLDDEDIYAPGIDPTAVRRTIGMVFQRPNPFPTMSVAGNVASGLRLGDRRPARGEMDGLVERALTQAGLWDEVKDRLQKPGASLSGGQQQRLCIARAIAVEPEVLLMDEPCSALDPVSTLVIEDLIADLKDRYTVVIVTHNMQQAARVSDVTAFFNLAAAGEPGRLVEVGPTAQIFTKPDDERTEAYITGRFG